VFGVRLCNVGNDVRSRGHRPTWLQTPIELHTFYKMNLEDLVLIIPSIKGYHYVVINNLP